MSWPMVKLGDIAVHIRNGASIKQNESSSGLPISRIETIANREVNFDKCGYADLGPEDYKEYRLASGDILISHINSEKHLGKCAIFESDRDDLVHGMNLLCMRPKDTVFPKFVFYYLSSDLFLSKIPNITKKSVNQASFTVTSFKELKIPFPPLAEQKRIAAILDKADAIRRKRQKAIQLADDFLRAVFLEMFGDPVTNPKGWEVKPLNDLCKKITDGEHGTVKRLETGRLYLMARNINRSGKLDLKEVSYISEEDHQRIYKRCGAEHGDVLLVCVGATIGKALIVPDIGEFSLARSVALLKPNGKITSEYLLSLINTDALQNQLVSSGNSSAQAGLYLGKIKEIQVPVPDLSLQISYKKIVNFVVNDLSEKIGNETRFEHLFESLSQKAFSGQL